MTYSKVDSYCFFHVFIAIPVQMVCYKHVSFGSLNCDISYEEFNHLVTISSTSFSLVSLLPRI